MSAIPNTSASSISIQLPRNNDDISKTKKKFVEKARINFNLVTSDYRTNSKLIFNVNINHFTTSKNTEAI